MSVGSDRIGCGPGSTLTAVIEHGIMAPHTEREVLQVYFVTSNENKVREAEHILGCSLKQIELEIKEIQSLDVEEIVAEKAREAFKKVGETVLVEDTGLYVAAWNGFPGGLIKWIMKTLGNDGLCKILREYDRGTTVKACVGLCNGSEVKLFTGEVTGTIVDEPRGTSGFGWDPLFQPAGSHRTFAEMSPEEKNSISHRMIAMKKMRDFLRETPQFL